MSTTFSARRYRIGNRSTWLAILGFWAAAAALSAVQIYLREHAGGHAPPWLDVLVANALAWVPWLLIAPLALGLERRFPLTGSRPWRNAAVHCVVSAAACASFLFYLAIFHLVYLEGHAFPVESDAIRAEYAEKLGRFFLTAMLLYGAIVIAGFAGRAWRSYKVERQRTARLAGRTREPTLVARSIGRVERIDPVRVNWIEGCGNYARLHLDGRSVLLRETLASLTAQLGAASFVRIHRSMIVNISRVAELRRGAHGEATVVLKDGRELKVSRTYRRALQEQAF